MSHVMTVVHISHISHTHTYTFTLAHTHTDIQSYTVYHESVVSIATAEFFTFVLDCLLSHVHLLTSDNNGILAYQPFLVITCMSYFV